MDRFLLPLLGALVGAVAGVFAARALTPPDSHAPAAPEARASDDLREQVAEIRRLLDRPALASAPAAPAAGTGTAPAAPAGAVVAPEQVQALATQIAQALEERKAAAEKAAKEAQAARKRRVPLAEAARELQLTAAQETEVRRAHEEAVEKYLKLLAEPEGDAESLRRELLAARNDPAKKRAIVTGRLPKFMSKLGEVMAIETERETRIIAAVGEDKADQLREYDLEEKDPFELGGNVTVGVRSGN
jgi:hypothetical protein